MSECTHDTTGAETEQVFSELQKRKMEGDVVTLDAGDPQTPIKTLMIDSDLPNGKIKHRVNENGLVSHILTTESPRLTENCDAPEEVEVCSSCESENTIDTPLTERSSIDCAGLGSDAESSLCEAVQHLGIYAPGGSDIKEGIEYIVYKSELQMPDIMRLITKDLSEPYSIYTYRYFIHNWPKLCFLAMDGARCVGAIVCKLDMHKKMVRRGYIAMLAVDSDYRRKRIGSHLVRKAIRAMILDDCDEVVLETEITNKAALRLYENLGFVRDKRLFRYYLNGVDALRLKLWLR
ncbi:N-alpha-acetyltransferase 30-like [Mizuhopecten yessoensis]|uniref:N-terminal methionine N(alpha)-acetyltransferase NatC n=1 Tax=Mizuhopecten yessoensis TaxID=6573 RepID=A0A210QX77_MIZYE|nr:N-alpha-acetyltransferase 30-like [Mizuhopecten yessoensis]OWF53360.1 N-alpha-acetyltransferase 30 [Mizuhopecten yessoensis]